jgi:hypothetical protein
VFNACIDHGRQAGFVSKDFPLRHSLGRLYGMVIKGPGVGPQQWKTFLRRQPNRCLRPINLPSLHVGLLQEGAPKSFDTCGRS